MGTTTHKKWQCLSGSWLKVIAMVTMLVDHVAVFLLYDRFWWIQHLFTVGKTVVTPYYILRTIGRLAFPIYCFLLVEGFIHTKNRRKYGLNLLIFALVSELPWNFVHAGTWLYGEQNVFFTLFFGYCCLCMIEHLKEKPVAQTVGILGVFLLSFFFKADYNYIGIAVILVTYLLRRMAVARAAVNICLLGTTWRAGLAYIPIGLYNGQRGFIRGRVGKYICYAFYPLHLLILGLLKHFVL